MTGVVFAFFYGFIGAFASGHGLTSIYPITAGLGLIGYQDGTATSYYVALSILVMLSLLAITGFLVWTAKPRETLSKRECKVQN